jgi:nucleotide-binding universal stress UspA family protein
LILIAYDGSDDAKAAIEQAGKLFPGETATVLTIWERFIDTMARAGAGAGLVVDYDAIDTQTAQSAAEKSEEGAKLANEAGLTASAKTAVVDTTISDSILDEAASAGASVVVTGSRGYTGVKSLMLGSVSHHLVQHADLPVVVVPSPAVATARAEHRQSLR